MEASIIVHMSFTVKDFGMGQKKCCISVFLLFFSEGNPAGICSLECSTAQVKKEKQGDSMTALMGGSTLHCACVFVHEPESECMRVCGQLYASNVNSVIRVKAARAFCE